MHFTKYCVLDKKQSEWRSRIRSDIDKTEHRNLDLRLLIGRADQHESLREET